MGCLMLDVDGVLVGSARPWTATLEADLGIRPVDLQTGFFKKYWHKIVIGQADIAPVLEQALREMRIEISAADLMAYWFSNDAAVVASVLEDVATLRQSGWRVWLATNQEHARATYLMENMGLGQHVDGICFSAALGARKPNRAFYREAALMSGSAGDYVLVDDTEANVKAARKYGWAAHHWTGRMSLIAAVETVS